MTNFELIKKASVEELAKILSEDTICTVCDFFNKEYHNCDFTCTKGYAEAMFIIWLESEAKE